MTQVTDDNQPTNLTADTNINWQNLEYNINFCTECGGDVEGKPQHAETNIRVAHSTGHICP